MILPPSIRKRISKALNNKEGVSEFTKQKILNICKELEYSPPRAENNLVNTKNIGFISSRNHSPVFHNPFYSLVISGIEIEVEKHDYNLLFSTINLKTHNFEEVPQIIRQNKVDGLILAGADIPLKLINKIEEINFPTVLVDNYVESDKIDYIVSDNYNGALSAVRHLIEMGHSSIGFVGGPLNHLSFLERFRAFKMEMMENRIPIDDNYVIIEEYKPGEMGIKAARKLLENKLPTAILAANDEIALNIMKTFQNAKINIPEDISLIGFDNIDITRYTSPSLTTVDINKEAMGQEAIRKLFDRIEDSDKLATKSVIPTNLVKRKSVKDIN
ncbi:MAG TPA: LacI family DNA-binding transcriptional regulator [Halanaerobiales bacterium]|nr:LacI family DNA-binding transcriptional regulator [Halanaerobiales bacterium]